jgi:hypothetical protein
MVLPSASSEPSIMTEEAQVDRALADVGVLAVVLVHDQRDMG